MRHLRWRALIVRAATLALALAAGPAAGALPADGPLGVATPGPLRALFLDMPLADVRPRDEVAVSLRWWLANSWSVPTRLTDRRGRVVLVQEDAQTDTLVGAVTVPWARLVRGAPRGLETTVEWRLLAHWGGWTDRSIEGWHWLVQSWNFERERYPRDRVALRLADQRGPALASITSATAGAGDLALRTLIPLVLPAPGEVGPLSLGLRADLKVPIGDPARLAGSGGWDAGLGLAATVAPHPWITLHAMGSVRAVSGLRGVSVQPNRLQAGLDVSLAVRPGRWPVVLLVEDRLVTALMRGRWSLLDVEGDLESTAWYSLFRHRNQISGGVRAGAFTVYLSEDFTPGRRLPGDRGPHWFFDSNDPDLVVGLTFDWPAR